MRSDTELEGKFIDPWEGVQMSPGVKAFGGGPRPLLLVLLGAWTPFVFTHHQ